MFHDIGSHKSIICSILKLNGKLWCLKNNQYNEEENYGLNYFIGHFWSIEVD